MLVILCVYTVYHDKRVYANSLFPDTIKIIFNDQINFSARLAKQQFISLYYELSSVGYGQVLDVCTEVAGLCIIWFN